jgi:demethylmenaquinone methyltransferase/2-methoxy-6-polyprenyl-1,4-benzoquinol methylase
MFDAIAPRYDLLNRLLTFRLDVGWRRRSIDSLALSRGSSVLDIAAGTGDLCRELEHRGLAPIALDLSAGMLRRPLPAVARRVSRRGHVRLRVAQPCRSRSVL